MRVAILGSCVTRDIFGLVPEKGWSVECYLGRQSMIALNTPPVQPDFSVAQEPATRWRGETVALNASKRVFETLRDTDFDCLVVDLIDERCACVATADGRMMTYSPELQEIAEGTPFLEHNGLRPLVEAWPYMDQREAALDAFAEGLRKACRGRPLVLHEAYWAPRSVAGETSVNYDVNWVARNNDLLALCYAGLKRRLNCWVVSAPRAETLGDAEHKWGPAPYHYQQSYYEHIQAQLDALPVYGFAPGSAASLESAASLSALLDRPLDAETVAIDVQPEDHFTLHGLEIPKFN
ncbi:DUF6270 domain-containing protein [Caulobacter sp. Root487D2Y]|uniref:DUF6270 domain-containing protein n=1 Tax=Caulobacter sp. Root487D2Y TaxID=1736547 RepID=UPI000A5672FE|nr:DUF6270 domain-containing protein [Caulobacter sp. Root487D2Y]